MDEAQGHPGGKGERAVSAYTAPPGISESVRPRPGLLVKCPKCGAKRFDYMSKDYGACERRSCGYEWHGPNSHLKK